MDYQKIGEVINSLRKHSNMTQKELAKDVCTQAQISKLENSDEIPSCITLFYISQKLGVDMNYFFETTYTPRLDYEKEVKTLIREQIRNQNYEEVLQIVEDEKGTPLFKSGVNRQFLLWNQGICEYHVNSQPEKALQMLDSALNITLDESRLLNEREIEIINSKAIIYKRIGEFSKAYTSFQYALEHINRLPKMMDYKVKIRLLYNISKVCFNNLEFQNSINFCKQGVEDCKKLESFHLLGEMLYQEGLCYEELKKYDEAKMNYQDALYMFKLQGKQKYHEIVLKSIKELEEKEASS